MDPNQHIEGLERFADETAVDEPESVDESESVDDFIRQLEEKEKDLHITSDTTIIEIAESFEDGELPDYLKEDFDIDLHRTIAPEPTGEFGEPPAPAEVEELVHEVEDLETEVADLEQEVARLRERLTKMEAEREEIFKTSQRRAKDFESYKARTERERGETFQTQLSNLATKMLPALDNLNRAVDFAGEMPVGEEEGVRQFFEGVMLVNRQIIDVLESMGIRPIKSVGRQFDPHYHEAVATEETDEFPANTICAELLRGYCIGDKVIRHSMVKVAVPANRGETETDPETGLTEAPDAVGQDAVRDVNPAEAENVEDN